MTFSSLNKNLLEPNDHDFTKIDCAQVQPIIFQNKNLIEDFINIHKTDVIVQCANFLKDNNKELFLKHLVQNKLYPLNMFITKVKFLENIAMKFFLG